MNLEPQDTIPPYALFPARLESLLPKRTRVDQSVERIRFEQVSESVVIVVVEPKNRPAWLERLLQED